MSAACLSVDRTDAAITGKEKSFLVTDHFRRLEITVDVFGKIISKIHVSFALDPGELVGFAC